MTVKADHQSVGLSGCRMTRMSWLGRWSPPPDSVSVALGVIEAPDFRR